MPEIQTLITENLDIWTGAITNKKAVGRGSRKKIELIGIKKLRELILELAIRGKLVPQDPNDEPASVLLEKIAIEKERLVKEKKIKKQKVLPEILDKEKSFNLPNSWEWARFPNISNYKPGKTPATKNPIFWEEVGNGLPWVSIADMNHFEKISIVARNISKEAVDKVFKYKPVKAGTILMSFKLTVGKVSILDVDAYHNEAIISITPFSGILKKYLYRFLPNRALSGNAKKAIKGNTLNSDSLALMLIPIPPEKEQHRIVKKVDELMTLCDQLEQQTEHSISTHQTLVDTLLNALVNPEQEATAFADSWTLIEQNFERLFTTEQSIDKLKQTILQLAVMGKLVPQDSNDEPASVLLEKIAIEKEQLIKEKKIKKQKPLPEISEDEKPFKLPSGWEWIRLGKIFNSIISGGTPSKQESKYWNGNIPWASVKDLGKQKSISKTQDYITEIGLKNGSKLADKSDILICTRMGLGKIVIANVPMAFNQDLKAVKLSSNINLNFFLNTYSTIKIEGTGTTVAGIKQEELLNYVIGIPPLAEQHRIVKKVDELMTLCDTLKAQLIHKKTTQQTLATALVEQTLSIQS